VFYNLFCVIFGHIRLYPVFQLCEMTDGNGAFIVYLTCILTRRNLDVQRDSKDAGAQREDHVRTQGEGGHLHA